ncbi:hypothetical protein [Halovivax ruber]|nr:hypothetical protein [Halovivax ruber]
MEYPRGRCDRCGERMYTQQTGGYRCYNCGNEERRRTSDRYRVR